MKNKGIEKLTHIINEKTDKAVKLIYKEFLGPNLLTAEVIEQFVDYYYQDLCDKKKNTDYFKQIGISSYDADTFIFLECRFIRRLLQTLSLLKPIDYLNENEIDEIKNNFEDSIHLMSNFCNEAQKQLHSNYDNCYPITVENFMSYIRHLFKLVNEVCGDNGFEFADTPFYEIIDEWLESMQKLYSPERLRTRLELMKQGPHALHDDVLVKFTFRDLFIEEESYQKVMTYLYKEGYVDENTGSWKDRKGGYKKVIVSFIKGLHTEPNCFRKDVEITNVLIHYVVINTFNVKVEESYIAKCKPQQFNYKKSILSDGL